MKSITFLGATKTVTGSKHLVTSGGSRVLVDCGLFQGLKQLRLKNWEPLPFDIEGLDAVLLTHAHIDHTGYLPRLVKDGYQGQVYASSATCALCAILLPDCGKLQEEDARYANRKGFSRHQPALPLFTQSEARACLSLLHPIPYEELVRLNRDFACRFGVSGHLLGSAFIQLTLSANPGEETRVLFSGDLGRSDRPIINDPEPPFDAEYLVLESTYGNRLHPPDQVKSRLASVVTETVARGGSVVIPTFAVGRAQEVMYLLTELREEKLIPATPIYVDSPMAVSATTEYFAHKEEHDADMKARMAKGLTSLRSLVTFVRGQSESKAVTNRREPSVVISSSGMAVGGRVLHHLAARLPDHRNTILFVGYQAAGTRGRALVDGAREVKIHGQMIPVNAQIVNMEELSAHADYEEILRWLGRFAKPPRRTFIVHGEESASEALQKTIRDRLGWDTMIPEYGQEVELK